MSKNGKNVEREGEREGERKTERKRVRKVGEKAVPTGRQTKSEEEN